MVLLTGAGGGALHREGSGGVAERGDHRRGRVLGDHQAAVEPRFGTQEGREATGAGWIEQPVDAALTDGGDVGARRREHVGGVRKSLSVEVSGTDDILAENHRVIDNTG